MSNRRKRGEDIDPFDQPTTETDYIYGDDDALMPTTAPPRVVPQIDIFKLAADPTQPRRAIPTMIRGDWDGAAAAVPGLLKRWHKAANNELSVDINIKRILKGYDGDRPEVDPQAHPIAYPFVKLIDLASGIHSTRLQNAIQVKPIGDGGLIYAGERRWLAFHTLALWSDAPKKYQSIPSVEGEFDRWEQAIENFARSDLNAISRARQLALLLMDIHSGQGGKEFDSYKALVSPGGCDRRFYAQVSNGYIYHTRGFADKILAATGLTNSAQISQYRNLLNLDDETWMQADNENWTENYCRVNFLQKSPKNEDGDIEKGFTGVKPLGDGLKAGEGYSQRYEAPDLPSPAGENGVMVDNADVVPTVDRKTVEVGQVRAYHAEQDVPYVEVIEQVGADMYMVNIVYSNRRMDNSRMSGASIRRTWKRLLSGVPDAPQPDVEDQTRLSPSEARKIVSGGLSVPQSSEMVDFDDDEDERIFAGVGNRRPSTYLDQRRMDGMDDGEQVAFIALRKKLDYLLSNWKNMAHQLDMPDQHEKLRSIYLWTPETVKKRMAEGGQTAVIQMIEEVEQAMLDIYNEFRMKWQDILLDVFDTAGIEIEEDA